MHTPTHLKQRGRRVELSHLSVVHDKDAVRVHDGVEAMSDRQHGAVSEGRPTQQQHQQENETSER